MKTTSGRGGGGLVLCFLLALGAAQAATYYVSPAGNDLQNGSSLSQAWATFDRALRAMGPGDTLLVADGTYYQRIAPNFSGNASAPVTIRAINDGRAIIEGDLNGDGIGDLNAGPLLHLTTDYFDVEGLVFNHGGRDCGITGSVCYQTGGVVRIQGGAHNILRRISAYNAHADLNSIVIGIVNGNDNLIEDCVAAGTGRKMMYVFGGDGTLAKRNIFRRCMTAWQQWDGREFSPGNWPWGDAIESYNASNNIFENVIAYGMAPGPGSGINIFSQAGMVTTDNAILGSMAIKAGLKWNGTPMTWPCPDPFNPTVTCSDLVAWQYRSGIRLGNADGSRVFNNLFQDVFAFGNAGTGFVVDISAGNQNQLVRGTLVNNGLVGSVGGSNMDSGKRTFFDTWTNNYVVGVDIAGSGARLINRYQSSFDATGKPVANLTSTPLWPWAMEDRIKSEFGVQLSRSLATNPELQTFSITATMQAIFNSLPTAQNPLGTSGSGDTIPPTAFVTAPAGGSTVSGSVSVTVTASDNVTVAGVQFKLDGNNLGAEVTAGPYATTLNSATVTNGQHLLTAVARDAAGNTAVSPAVSITINNPTGPLGISGVTDNRTAYASSQIPKYSKIEITFQVDNTVATNFQLPYDAAPPPGISPGANPMHKGISVDAQFSQDNFLTFYSQPAFYYAGYDDQVKSSWDGQNHEWHAPTGTFSWKVRFSPTQTGNWQYRIVARDASGTTQSANSSFAVAASASHGPIRVSPTDARYFEFADGTPFVPAGINLESNLADPVLANQALYGNLAQNGINFLRVWISNIYGSAWLEWLGGRNRYDGYLPRSGMESFRNPATGKDQLTQVLMYNDPTGWYDACRFQFWNDPESIKPNTNYRLSIKYFGSNIAGPRIALQPAFGLVGKISNTWAPNCEDPGTSTVVTNYGKDTSDFATVEGVWNSGNNNFLPRIYLGLENATQGKVYVDSISLREVLPSGQYGPEVITESSMQYELYFPQEPSYSMDKLLTLAESSGMYLKLVLSDLNDSIYYKLNDDGSFAFGADNQDGFYGLGRTVNKTRWLQQAWWRYAQARWGYSPNVHSWELTNEGDPYLATHWQMTDEFGKFMHCGVFGAAVATGNSARCSLQHPNRHMVTTSFWTDFPGYSAQTGQGFWGNPQYPNVDYADVHAYISTSQAPLSDRTAMQSDSAYYHLWHSGQFANWKLPMPVVRGEAGMDLAGQHATTVPGLQSDLPGQWYHDYLWSGLDSGGLYELYWWFTPDILNVPSYDHRPSSLSVKNFLAGIPLSNGRYQDAAAVVSNPDLRVAGQRDLTNRRAYLWIQNKNHTWKNVLDGASIAPVSGTVTIPGFSPGQAYEIEWWDTYKTAVQISSRSTVTASANGNLTLTVQGLGSDIAAKIAPSTAAVNQPPAVSAGGALAVSAGSPIVLNGSASDDGLPNGTLTFLWSKVSGPGTVAFGNAAVATTSATFSVAGTYVIRLTANDGVLAANADATVTVAPVGTSAVSPPGSLIAIPSAAPAAGWNACDLSQDGSVNVVDVQLSVNMALGLIPCGAAINGLYSCTVTTIQRIVNTVLGQACRTDPMIGPPAVQLTWAPGGGALPAGYHLFRASAPGASFAKINPSQILGTAYTDITVSSGQVYYYYVTAADNAGNQSSGSNLAQALVP